jgi:hypothetical protein
MAIFDLWDIVKVPFPYTDRPVRQRRPALVAETRRGSAHCRSSIAKPLQPGSGASSALRSMDPGERSI